MKPGKSNRRAFTLVEILIVICVISILFVVLVSRVDFATDKARTTGAQNDLRALQMAIHQVAIEDGELVDDLNLLASRLNENLDSELMVHVENNELVSNAKDPWGSYYKISYSKPANSKGQAVVISAGPDMKYSSTDDVGKTISCQVSASGMNVTVQDTLPSVPGGSLPVEPEEHICNFSKAVQTTEHIKTAGNCSSPVVYFYSCECGANGTATFTGPKDLNTHVSESTYNYNSLNEDQHTSVKVCSGCNTILDTNTEMHSFSDNVCTKCGHERHVHSYTNQNPVEANKATSATCSAAATYYYTCACGAKGTSTFVSGNALAHNYSGRVTTDPTCTATGVRTYTCSTCSNSYTELVEKTPHNYNKQIEDGHLASSATCKDYAKYYWSCVCGANSTNTFDGTVLSTTHTGGTETKYEYVDENTHKVSSICKTCTAVIATSTNSHGNIVNNACSLCNGHMHSFTRQVMSNYTRVTEATCQAQATYRYSCADTNCDVLSDTSNVFAGGEKVTHQSTIGGTSDVHTKCSICGTTISVTHDYTTTTTKDATCTESGTKKHTCTCGYFYTETINKLGHDIVSHAAKAATCTTNGYAAYDTCSRCNYTTYKEIVATGHKDTNGGTSAIHTKCSKCGTTTSSKHSYSSKITVAATCTSKGTTTYTCSCGYSYSAQDVEKNASNHTGSTTYQYSNITVYTHTVTEYCGGCKVKLNKDSYEENHSKTETCKCGYIKYDMLSGSQQTVHVANNNDVTFRSEANYNDFQGLYIDNALVDSSNYTVTEGSTIITIKAAYMSSMNDGEHTIDIVSTNGMASTTFEVVDTNVYALSGKWKFNDTFTMWMFDNYNVSDSGLWGSGGLVQNITFISNNQTFSKFDIALSNSQNLVTLHIKYDSEHSVYTQYSHDWQYVEKYYGLPITFMNDNYNILDFGSTPQEVSKEFYEWFTTNATKQETYTLSGKWKWNDVLTYHDNSNWLDTAPDGITTNTLPKLHFSCIINGEVQEFNYISFQTNCDLVYRNYTVVNNTNLHVAETVIYGDPVWLQDDIAKIIDFGTEEYEVNAYFWNWFMQNATPYNEPTYALSGKWVFNNVVRPVNGENIIENISFTSDGQIFNEMEVYMPTETSFGVASAWLNYGPATSGVGADFQYFGDIFTGECAYLWYSNNTENLNLRLVDFGSTPQSVSKEFYTWFITNATNEFVIDGSWMWNDVLKFDENYTSGEIYSEPIVFTSSSYKFNNIKLWSPEGIMLAIEYTIYDAPYGDGIGIFEYYKEQYGDGSQYWDNTFKVMNFGNVEQAVSPEFYTWFTSNAARVSGEIAVGFLHNYEMFYMYEPFAFEIGMTWEEFVYSDYNKNLNTGKQLFTIENGYVISLMEIMCPSAQNANFIIASDIMIYPGIYTECYMDDCKIVYGHDLLESSCMNGHMSVQSGTLSPVFVYNGSSYCTYCGQKLNEVTFAIDNVEYKAIEGMTWEEWVNSVYNTDGYIIQNNSVYSKDRKKVGSVSKTDKITSGISYITINGNVSHSGGSND